MFYRKKYRQAIDSAEMWRKLYFKSEAEKDEMAKDYQNTCDWLEEKYENLRRKDPFTFDKAEYQRLKLENADLKKEVEELRAKNKGAKK